jgi:hypothetical protein
VVAVALKTMLLALEDLAAEELEQNLPRLKQIQ